MSQSQEIDEFFEKIDKLKLTPTDELITNSEEYQTDGVLVFTEIRDKIEELKQYLNLLNKEDIAGLPEPRFKLLQSTLKPILDKIEAIQTTVKNPNQADAAQKQATVQFFTFPATNNNGYFEKTKDDIWKLILESLVLSNRKSQDSSISTSKLKEIELAASGAKKSKEEIDKVLNSARTELSKGGVSKHSGIFEDQAAIHKSDSVKWQNKAVGLLITNALLILAVLSLVIWVVDDKALRIEVGIFGAALVSLLSYGVVLCVKNFFAEKHNQNVNQHRANCLGTYNTFVDSADEDRKAAVLLQATNTIFSHQRSGYLTRDTDTNSPNPIIEIVKNVSQNKPNE